MNMTNLSAAQIESRLLECSLETWPMIFTDSLSLPSNWQAYTLPYTSKILGRPLVVICFDSESQPLSIDDVKCLATQVGAYDELRRYKDHACIMFRDEEHNFKCFQIV